VPDAQAPRLAGDRHRVGSSRRAGRSPPHRAAEPAADSVGTGAKVGRRPSAVAMGAGSCSSQRRLGRSAQRRARHVGRAETITRPAAESRPRRRNPGPGGGIPLSAGHLPRRNRTLLDWLVIDGVIQRRPHRPSPKRRRAPSEDEARLRCSIERWGGVGLWAVQWPLRGSM
jgi:hypothetical protein